MMCCNSRNIYFIGTADRSMVKIGSSVSVGQRLQRFMSLSPVKLFLFATAPGNLHDEYAVHAAFADSHSHLEWFRASPALLATIDLVAQTGALPDGLRGKHGQKNPNAATRKSPEQVAKLRATNARKKAEKEAARKATSA